MEESPPPDNFLKRNPFKQLLEQLRLEDYLRQSAQIRRQGTDPSLFLSKEEVESLKQELLLEGFLVKIDGFPGIVEGAAEKTKSILGELTGWQQDLLSPSRVFVIKDGQLKQFADIFLGKDKLTKPPLVRKMEESMGKTETVYGQAGLYGIITVKELTPLNIDSAEMRAWLALRQKGLLPLWPGKEDEGKEIEKTIYQGLIIHEWMHYFDRFFTQRYYHLSELAVDYLVCLTLGICGSDINSQTKREYLQLSEGNVQMGEIIEKQVGGREKLIGVMKTGKATREEIHFFNNVTKEIRKRLVT